MVASATGASFPVVNGAIPCEGTKAFPINLDFTGGKNAYSVDFTQQYNAKQFSTLQTVFIDNSGNGSSTQVVVQSGTAQVINAPPFSQGYYALLAPVPPKFIVQSNGGVVLQVIFLNFYIPPEVWLNGAASASGIPQVDIPALDPLITAAGLEVVTVPAPETNTDKSGTITAGGTPQLLMAANASRKSFKITNPTTATEILQFSFGAGGNGKIDIPAGQTYESGPTVSQQSIFIVAATTAHAFVAYEGT